MAWETEYWFDIIESDIDINEHLELVAAFRNTSEEARFALDNDGNSYTSLKSWNTLRKDLIEFSKQYPEHVFQIEGVDDDRECWRYYAKNGMIQEDFMKFHGYDPDLMTSPKYDIISPDGLSFYSHIFDLFNSEEEARTKGIPAIKKRYERQGYYSSNNGKIPLDELEKHCKIVAL